MDLTEKHLSSKRVYNGIIVNVDVDDAELCTGQKVKREVVKHSGGVVIVAQKTPETVIFVKQHRYPIHETILELPAGKLEKSEDPFEAAKRELEEETGYIAKKWTDLGYITTSPGFCDEKLYLYLAQELTFTATNPDDGEIIEPLEYNLDEIFSMIKNCEINDAKTICAIHRAFKA